jgi:hypothetical protein
MITDGTLHAFVPVTGSPPLLVQRFASDPRQWLPPGWADGWVTLEGHGTHVPARCSLGPPTTADGVVRRTVLLDPHGGRAAAPGFVGTVELRADERGATLLLRARYRYAHPEASPEVGQRLAHDAAVRWLTRMGAGLERVTARTSDERAASRRRQPAVGRPRFGRLRVVPG